MDEKEIDVEKVKAWWKIRKSKAEKRKKWGWPLIIIWGLIVFSFVFVKFNCTWDNDGTYENDKIFFFKGFWYECVSFEEFDKVYQGGQIRICLDLTPGSDPYNCRMPIISDKMVGGDVLERINFTIQEIE